MIPIVIHGAGRQPEAELEAALAAVDDRLAGLGTALRDRDAMAIDQHASELHRALATAVERFALAARSGSVPPALRRRLAHASGQVAAQRESLARATAALDLAIDMLIPRDGASLCSPSGSAERGRQGKSVIA